MSFGSDVNIKPRANALDLSMAQALNMLSVVEVLWSGVFK